MDKINFSIIIVSHNSEHYLNNCINSILNARSGFKLEIIVVDNGSTDHSRELISHQFKEVRLIQNKNTGFGQGCNLGAKTANGRYLIFLNPDSEIKSDFFINLFPQLANDRQIIIPTILQMKEKTKINTCGNIIHFTGLGTLNAYQELHDPNLKFKEIYAISGACFCISKDLFSNLEGFDPNLFLYCEDTELSVRIQKSGYEILHANNAIVFHDYHFKMSPKKVFFQEFGRYYILRKHFSWSALILLSPSLFIMDLIIWIYVLGKGRSFIWQKLIAYKSFMHFHPNSANKQPLPMNALAENFNFKLITNNSIFLRISILVNAVFKLNFLMGQKLLNNKI